MKLYENSMNYRINNKKAKLTKQTFKEVLLDAQRIDTQ
jgi:hypothetical protein